jgi:hypothetical protein
MGTVTVLLFGWLACAVTIGLAFGRWTTARTKAAFVARRICVLRSSGPRDLR